MFLTVKLLSLALGLIGCVTASPIAVSPVVLHKRGQNVIIGYRTVDPVQARTYNKAGTLTYYPNLIGVQTGKGVYTTAGLGDWKGKAGDWFCVIFADSDALKRVSKAWVPETYYGKKLWYEQDNVINNYIKDLEDSWNPSKTLRLSTISGDPQGFAQMAIPFDLLDERGGAMGITVSCKEKMEELPNARVNYND